jgi:hypothetical protein
MEVMVADFERRPASLHSLQHHSGQHAMIPHTPISAPVFGFDGRHIKFDPASVVEEEEGQSKGRRLLSELNAL